MNICHPTVDEIPDVKSTTTTDEYRFGAAGIDIVIRLFLIIPGNLKDLRGLLHVVARRPWGGQDEAKRN